jgi:hypothetical protein
MNYTFNKIINASFFIFCLFFFQNNALWGQTIEKSANRTYLDSILHLLPVQSPQDTSMFWLARLPLDTLPDLELMSDDEILRYTYQLADKAVIFENDINQKAQNSINTQLKLENSLKAANADDSTEQIEIDSLKKALKRQKSLAKKTLTNQKTASKTSIYALECTKLEVDNMRKSLPKLRKKVVELADICHVDSEVLVPLEVKNANKKGGKTKKEKTKKVEEVKKDKHENEVKVGKIKKEKVKKDKPKKVKVKKPKAKKGEEAQTEEAIEAPLTETTESSETPIEVPVKTTKSPATSEKKFATYSIKEDVMLNPLTPTCQFSVNKTDEFSGKIYKELVYEEAFRYTNDFMKSHLNGKPHIVCEASLGVLGDLTLLNLKVTINELNALKSFGGIQKNGICTLKLINGNVVNLLSIRDEDGILDEVGGFCVFNMQFSGDKSSLKLLQKSELDKIKISWKRGFEEYEIYNVDIFKRQSSCF